jgi:hypothetical protein
MKEREKMANQDSRLSRVRTYAISPREVCLIGRAKLQADGKKLSNVGSRDTDHGSVSEHPQWQERAREPYDEATVLNYLANGVILPVVAIKEVVHDDGQQDYVIIDGRGRIINAREAERRRQEDPKWSHLPPIRVRLIIRKGGTLDGLKVAASANEFRKPPSVLARARGAKLMLDHNASEEEVCVTYGIGQQQLDNWLDGLGASDQLLAAVERGEDSFSSAVEQAKKKKKTDQKPRPKSSAPGRAKIRRIVNSPTAMGLLERSFHQEEETERVDVPELLVEVLKWIGGEGALESFPHLKAALDHLALPPSKQKAALAKADGSETEAE